MKKLKLQYIITFCVLDGGTLLERKAFILSFVKIIKVTDNAQLSHTMPLPPNWVSEEAPRVLYSVRFGGAKVSIGRTFEVVFSLCI